MQVQGQSVVDGKMSHTSIKKTIGTPGKVSLFKSFFSGLADVYGTYDPLNGRSWQVKAPVTDEVILSHLKGVQPYGVYLLDGSLIKAIAVDFDHADPFPPSEFINSSQHYLLPAYLEASKSKGFHVWIFFNEKGVTAAKARTVVKHILSEIEHPDVEIFPKQDILDQNVSFGNFINAPLFGSLVPHGKTVFLDPATMKPYPDQWEFLNSVERLDESRLDDIIELNNLTIPPVGNKTLNDVPKSENFSRFGLPPCAQKMLQEGVTHYQRVSCFRLAVHFKRLGLPYDVAVAALRTWATKNRPDDGKRVITEREIMNQASYAYHKSYQGYGCHSAAIRPFCQPECPLKR